MIWSKPLMVPNSPLNGRVYFLCGHVTCTFPPFSLGPRFQTEQTCQQISPVGHSMTEAFLPRFVPLHVLCNVNAYIAYESQFVVLTE